MSEATHPIIERLASALQAIESCTQPIDGHTDPLSVNDCWATVHEIMEVLKNDHLLDMAKQFKAEQSAICSTHHTDYDGHILTGISRIVALIDRYYEHINKPYR